MIKTNYNAAYFNNALYKANPVSWRDVRRATLIRRHKQRGRLLEIGCGEGYLLRMLAAHFDVRGLELSSYASDFANSLFEHDAVSRGNIEHTQPTETFDVIVAFNLLEHVQRPKDALQRISNALAPNGILVGSVPNNQYYIGRGATRISNIIDKTHVNTLPVPKWRALFEAIGLHCAEEFGEVPALRNHSTYIRNRLWPYISFNYVFVYYRRS